ncbi:toxic anion resistance protein [Paenibacillus gansuensis]|uniref:Toxic anion resistance protein n=1 Tax=Paenibacillus gansuensis TaxID=306542 RepID=A0ABW5PEI3_9BACL
MDSDIAKEHTGAPRPADDQAWLQTLTEEERAQAQTLAAHLDIMDSASVAVFGYETQEEISSFSDQVLSYIRTKDGGYAGQMLSELMLKIKEVNIETLSSKKGFASKLPVFGTLFDRAKRVLAQYQKVGVQLEEITARLDEARMQLMKDNVMLDTFYKKNVAHFKQLALYIAAGQLKLQELKERVIPELQQEASNTTDPVKAQELSDMIQCTGRFEKKVHELIVSRTIAIQTAPQLRLIQNNNQMLAEKIQSSILTTIPLWKNQIAIAVSLFRQGKALELQREVTNATNELLLQNSELLKSNNADIVRENEKGVVEVDTLKRVHANLIATLEDTIRIQKEGSAQRKQAETDIARLEAELKNKIGELAGK